MDIINKLTKIGFNKLESEVYHYLLTHHAATAYKIGKDIKKPTANVYKAIDSLKLKGAVTVEIDKNKLCSAVSPDEFINQFEKQLLRSTTDLREELKNLTLKTTETSTHSIDSVSLAFEKFENMMNKCESIAVIDAFPKTLELMKPIIEKNAKRGINVNIEAYEEISIKNANVSITNIGKKALSHWKSQQLNLVIDGQEYLLALMDNNLEKIIQATWSNNIYLSCMLHGGFLKEQTVIRLLNILEEENFTEKAKDILESQKFFYNSNIPGFNKLKSII